MSVSGPRNKLVLLAICCIVAFVGMDCSGGFPTGFIKDLINPEPITPGPITPGPVTPKPITPESPPDPDTPTPVPSDDQVSLQAECSALGLVKLSCRVDVQIVEQFRALTTSKPLPSVAGTAPISPTPFSEAESRLSQGSDEMKSALDDTCGGDRWSKFWRIYLECQFDFLERIFALSDAIDQACGTWQDKGFQSRGECLDDFGDRLDEFAKAVRDRDALFFSYVNKGQLENALSRFTDDALVVTGLAEHKEKGDDKNNIDFWIRGLIADGTRFDLQWTPEGANNIIIWKYKIRNHVFTDPNNLHVFRAITDGGKISQLNLSNEFSFPPGESARSITAWLDNLLWNAIEEAWTGKSIYSNVDKLYGLEERLGYALSLFADDAVVSDNLRRSQPVVGKNNIRDWLRELIDNEVDVTGRGPIGFAEDGRVMFGREFATSDRSLRLAGLGGEYESIKNAVEVSHRITSRREKIIKIELAYYTGSMATSRLAELEVGKELIKLMNELEAATQNQDYERALVLFADNAIVRTVIGDSSSTDEPFDIWSWDIFAEGMEFSFGVTAQLSKGGRAVTYLGSQMSNQRLRDAGFENTEVSIFAEIRDGKISMLEFEHPRESLSKFDAVDAWSKYTDSRVYVRDKSLHVVRSPSITSNRALTAIDDSGRGIVVRLGQSSLDRYAPEQNFNFVGIGDRWVQIVSIYADRCVAPEKTRLILEKCTVRPSLDPAQLWAITPDENISVRFVSKIPDEGDGKPKCLDRGNTELSSYYGVELIVADFDVELDVRLSRCRDVDSQRWWFEKHIWPGETPDKISIDDVETDGEKEEFPRVETTCPGVESDVRPDTWILTGRSFFSQTCPKVHHFYALEYEFTEHQWLPVGSTLTVCQDNTLYNNSHLPKGWEMQSVILYSNQCQSLYSFEFYRYLSTIVWLIKRVE